MARWNVEISSLEDDLPATLIDHLEKAARAVLQAENASDTELSVALVDDAEMERLNREYLSHDGPTDVISFPLVQPGLPLVGDIYVGIDQARRQAADLGIDPAEELARLVIHGTLHVLGWEHPETEDRTTSPMFIRQEEILRQLHPIP
jgi:probable rRNA maturation factor